MTYLDSLAAHFVTDGEYGGQSWSLVRTDDGSYFTVWTDECEIEPCDFGPFYDGPTPTQLAEWREFYHRCISDWDQYADEFHHETQYGAYFAWTQEALDA